MSGAASSSGGEGGGVATERDSLTTGRQGQGGDNTEVQWNQ